MPTLKRRPQEIKRRWLKNDQMRAQRAASGCEGSTDPFVEDYEDARRPSNRNEKDTWSKEKEMLLLGNCSRTAVQASVEDPPIRWQRITHPVLSGKMQMLELQKYDESSFQAADREISDRYLAAVGQLSGSCQAAVKQLGGEGRNRLALGGR